jgi:hypothetical protein
LMYHWKYLITLGLQERSGCVANEIMTVRVTDSGTVSRTAVCSFGAPNIRGKGGYK